MGPRQEIRIESINRLHVQSGVRDVQEPQIRRHVLENGHLVALGIPHLLVYTENLMKDNNEAHSLTAEDQLSKEKTEEKKPNHRKPESVEHQEKRHAREQKELAYREKQLARPTRPLYLWYLFFVLCLAYIVDEAASGIGGQFQSNIIKAFFEIDGRDYTGGLALMSQLGLIGTACNLLML